MTSTESRLMQRIVLLGLGVFLLCSTNQEVAAAAEWNQVAYRVSTPGSFVRDAPILLSRDSEQIHLFWAEQSKLPSECAPGPDNPCVTTLEYARFDGANWRDPVETANVGGARIYTLTVAIDRQQSLFAAWVENTGGALRGEIKLTQASLSGDSAMSSQGWSDPVTVPLEGPATDNIILRIDGNGVLHLVFSRPDADNPPGSVPGLYYARSTDSGTQWSSPVQLKALPENWDLDRILLEIDDQNGLHLAWLQSEASTDATQFQYSRSLDGGSSWSSEFMIDEFDPATDNLMTENVGIPYGFVVSGQEIHSVWVGGPKGAPRGVGRKHRYSTDRGTTWSEISTDIFDLWGVQNGDGLAADGAGHVHWVGNARSQEVLQDGLWSSHWNQQEWSEPEQVFPNTTDNSRLASTDSGRLLATFKQTTVENAKWDALYAMNSAMRTFYFPHYGDGSGLSMLFAINNLSEDTATGKLRLHDNDGSLKALEFEDIGTLSEVDLSIEPNSTRILRTRGTSTGVETGYVGVELDQQDVSGVAIFKYASGPEASVLPARPGRRFALFVERSGSDFSTGLAFARITPDQPLSLKLYELDGTLWDENTSYTMSGAQEARFVQDLFPTLPSEFQGLLVVESEALFTCVGLRFGGGILSTIPVSDLDSSETRTSYLFPHYGDGSGLSTYFVINNLLDTAVEGDISFFHPDGTLQELPLEGRPADDQVSLDLDAKATQVLRTDGSTNGLKTGFSVVELDQPGTSGVAIFKYSSGPEASVLPSYPGTKFTLFVERSAVLDTGFAIVRTQDSDLTLSLYDMDGNLIDQQDPFDNENRHLAKFLTDVFNVPGEFRGLLILESEAEFSTIGLRFGGGVLSTIPVTRLE